MSFFLSPYLARLQDLKLWQGNYDMLLQNQNSDVLSSIDSLSLDDGKNVEILPQEPPKTKMTDWDKQTISPTKPFEQLLEEKLKGELPGESQKPKKPYLRKGSGLVRYNSYNPVVKTKKVHVTSQVKQKLNFNPSQNKQASKDENVLSSSPANKCQKNILDVVELDYDLNAVSLKIPDVVNKPKATWHSIMSNKNNVSDKTESAHNNDILQKINQFTFTNFIQKSPKKNTSPKSNNLIDFNCSNDIPSTKTIFEYTSDKDLKVFEVLEERVEHSSFSSNNSSIVRLLSSTPNKGKLKPANSPILEEKSLPNNLKFEEAQHRGYDHKQKVLHDFLSNLRKIVDDKDVQVDFEDFASDKKNSSPSTSYSENWSSNTDTRTQSPSSFYTDFETTFKNINSRIDAAVNTSFNETVDQRVQISIECEKCGQLQRKLDELMKDLPNIQAEKAKVCDFANELEKKRDELKIEMEKMKNRNQETIYDLKQELQMEKKKYEQEKAIFDMYIKESRNRPSKKEREEISDLKKELADTRELLKLKDTKNGASQARLRTQIKQLEKEKNELKNTVETLQKENAKLNATKKFGRPPEVKMLHEINKNLTKLTSETLKNQMNKSRSVHNASNTEEVTKNARSNLKSVKSSNNNRDTSSLEILEMENVELQRQYEHMFGQIDSNFQNPQENISNMNDSKPGKTEKVFPDGSKEITYSNGNTKTISPDGNIIIIQYYNGDIKETNLLKNIMKYYYVENGTWHTQFGDGTELLEYSNGQKEKKYTDGKREVTCPDGTFLTKLPDGTEEFLYPDGSKMIKTSNEKIILLPNGQKEIHTSENKRREYPDGTVKILYFDGTQETRYPSGRIRIKDPNGILIMDK